MRSRSVSTLRECGETVGKLVPLRSGLERRSAVTRLCVTIHDTPRKKPAGGLISAKRSGAGIEPTHRRVTTADEF